MLTFSGLVTKTFVICICSYKFVIADDGYKVRYEDRIASDGLFSSISMLTQVCEKASSCAESHETDWAHRRRSNILRLNTALFVFFYSALQELWSKSNKYAKPVA